VVARLWPSDTLDNIFVRGRFHSHGVLQKPVEEFAPASRGASVESKRELIEVREMKIANIPFIFENIMAYCNHDFALNLKI
jgi:hypothetical protein